MASEFGKYPLVQHVVDVVAMVIIRVLHGDLGANGGNEMKLKYIPLLLPYTSLLNE